MIMKEAIFISSGIRRALAGRAPRQKSCHSPAEACTAQHTCLTLRGASSTTPWKSFKSSPHCTCLMDMALLISCELLNEVRPFEKAPSSPGCPLRAAPWSQARRPVPMCFNTGCRMRTPRSQWSDNQATGSTVSACPPEQTHLKERTVKSLKPFLQFTAGERYPWRGLEPRIPSLSPSWEETLTR